MADINGNKTGGRVKGVPNKNNADLLAFWDEKDFCPAQMVIEKLLDEKCTLTDKEKVDTCLKLMKFKFAEKKAVEVSIEQETKESFEDYIKSLEYKK
jgi:hypothetical protein